MHAFCAALITDGRIVHNGELASAGAENHYGEGELEKSELGLDPLVAQLGNYRGSDLPDLGRPRAIPG